MTKFQPAVQGPMTEEQLAALAKTFGITMDAIKKVREEEERDTKIYINDKYQVAMRISKADDPGWPDIIHLSIKRLDKEPIHDWRDLQKIKNELVDPEIEMWECYPPESNLVDTANQYHLWGFATFAKIIPFGWSEGRKVVDHDPELEKQSNTKQRKL
jgi:Mg2+ and Co2+ transporter CorA